MISGAVLEFLNENAARRYPLIEDCVPTVEGVPGPLVLEDNIVLDARGFSRERNEVAAKLSALVGPGAGSHPLYPAVVGQRTLYWEMGTLAAPLRMALGVPLDNVAWPFVGEASAPDFRWPGRQVRRASLRVTLGQAIAGLPLDARWLLGDRAPLEISVIHQLYRAQLDGIRLVHQDGTNEWLAGDLEVMGGYNVDVVTGENIMINPVVGGGTLGRWIQSLVPDAQSACRNAILQLGGAVPNSRGELTFLGGRGIKIEARPESHTIILAVDLSSLGGYVSCST